MNATLILDAFDNNMDKIINSYENNSVKILTAKLAKNQSKTIRAKLYNGEITDSDVWNLFSNNKDESKILKKI